MIDANKTPYILAGVGLLSGLIAWLFKHLLWEPLQKVIKDVGDLTLNMVAVQTSLRYYLDTTGKGAATVLDTPNPTPPQMSVLLKKYKAGTLTDEEKPVLTEWLRQVIRDPHEVGKRGAALSLLAAIGGMERLQASR